MNELLKNPERGLKMKQLDAESLHLRVYSDSSFANNDDLTSQLGYVVLLCDKNDNGNVVSFSSHKSRRIVRSVLGGEVYAFADAFDVGYIIKRDLEIMLDRSIRLQMFTDSKSLFDIITKCGSTTQKRLLIDVKSVREAYNNHEVSDVGFLRSEHNPADSFTKISANESLQRILSHNKVDFPVAEWIIRSTKKEKE